MTTFTTIVPYINVSLFCCSIIALSLIIIIEIKRICDSFIFSRCQKLELQMAQTQSTTNVETQSSSNNDATATTSTTDSNKTNQQSQQSQQVLNEPLIFNTLPIIAYLSYLVSSGMQLSSIFTASIQTCYRDTIIVIVGYSIGKMLTYLLFVYRVHIVYNESSFQYNVKILIIFAIFIIIYMTAT
eukprot:168044_1